MYNTAQVVSQSGHVVQSILIPASASLTDLSIINLPAGLYTIRLSGTKASVYKIVKR